MTARSALTHAGDPAGARSLICLPLLWLAGAGLRITVLAVPPIMPLLHADLKLNETEIGILSSLPSLLFAGAAVPGSLLIARIGAVPTLVAGLVLTAAASAARGIASDVATLYATTILMALGVAVMQPSLPPLVRAWRPHAIGFATAVYTNGLLIGETLTVALTIPVVLPLVGGSWRGNMVVWALPVAATAVLVLLFAPRSARPAAGAVIRWWPDWRRKLVWRLGFILGSVNSIYFTTNNFLPDFLTASGRPDLIGSALTALNLAQLPASFLMLVFAGRLARRPAAYVATGVVSLVSLLGIIAMSGPWIVLWAAVLGFANAVTLILALALPPLLSAPDDVHRTSAAMFTISYSCAVVIPIIGGALWDATNQPVSGLAPVAVCAVVIAALSATLRFPKA